MARPGRARNQQASCRPHTADVRVCDPAVGPTKPRHRASAMYPHRSGASTASSAVHDHIFRMASYGQAECTSWIVSMTRDWAEPSHDTPFIPSSPHTGHGCRLGKVVGCKSSISRASRYQAADTQNLASDVMPAGTASGMIHIKQGRKD